MRSYGAEVESFKFGVLLPIPSSQSRPVEDNCPRSSRLNVVIDHLFFSESDIVSQPELGEDELPAACPHQTCP